MSETITTAEQQASELRKLLRADGIPWPVATQRSQQKLVPVTTALDFVRDVVDRLDGDSEETRSKIERWRDRQGELTGPLGYLMPGIVKIVVEQRESLITEGLDWLTRLQANYENGETAIDEALGTIAKLDALAAGMVPEEE